MSVALLSWRIFWEKAAVLADSLKPDLTGEMSRLWIPMLDTQNGLFLFAAALHLGLDPLFDEKSSLDPDAISLRVTPESWERFAKDQDLASPDTHFMLSAAEGIPLAMIEALAPRTFYFSSSGTTAKAKTMGKSAMGLLREVKLLQKLYDLSPQARIATLVRPFHIYGFLHSVLLPLLANASALYWTTRLSLPTDINGFPDEMDLTITAPAHWSVLTHLWTQLRSRIVVTSGAFFGQARALELLEHKKSFDRYFEILGSTETGGIGFRRVDQPGFSFTLFEGIRLEEKDDGSCIHSPFLIPDPSIHSPDRFEVLADGKVLHLGRADRVFKYAGLRYTLGEVEDLFSTICEGAAVVCVFEEKINVPQGGLLRAWIETSRYTAEDLIPLRKTYQSFGNRPFPAALHFLPAFPRDAQGKVSLLALKSLLPQEKS